jgi:phage tail-like protein
MAATKDAVVELYAAFSFSVELGNGARALFSECTLPSLEVDVLERKEGGFNEGAHLLAGPVKAGRVTLKRGVTQSSELLQWYRAVATGNPRTAERNITIVMYDAQGQPVLRLNFERAYPVKWSGPSFRSSDSSIAIEALELAFTEFRFE